MKTNNAFNAVIAVLVILILSLACKTLSGGAPDSIPPGASLVATRTASAQGAEARNTSETTAPPLVEPTQENIHQGDDVVPNTDKATETPQTQPAQEVLHQWGVSAVASSQYGNPNWSAAQAIGLPDTQDCGDIPTAWASAFSNGVDWLEIRYETPVYPEQINIIQTHMPDQVVKVELIDTMSNHHIVYTAQPMITDCPYTLTVDVADADYQVAAIKLTVDQTILDPTSWNEIDAVELVGRYDGGAITASVNPTPTANSALSPSDYTLPTMSPSSIAAEMFYYEVAGAGEDATIDKGTLQDQSTSDEYVLGFVSENFRYAVSLFLPHGLNTGPLSLKQYARSSFTKGPSAAIYIGSGYYFAEGGLVNIESVTGNSVTGSFIFTAISEYDASRVVTVSGVFNRIPLVNK